MRIRPFSRAVLVLAAMTLALGGCGPAGSGARPAPVSSPASQRPAPSGPARSSTVPPPPASPAEPPPSPPVLAPGASGQAVRQLQLRLAALAYFPGPADGQFGTTTLAALWAFQEVQGLPPTGRTGPATWQALSRPRPPAALVPAGGSTRVEISLTDEVLVLYRAGHVALISHVSTGGGYYYCSPADGCGYAVTPVGDFKTTSYIPGWVTVPLGQMYNPVFFIGTAYAIHGATDVPLGPASHGCVRIPMDIAQFFPQLVPTPGTPVYIRR